MSEEIFDKAGVVSCNLRDDKAWDCNIDGKKLIPIKTLKNSNEGFTRLFFKHLNVAYTILKLKDSEKYGIQVVGDHAHDTFRCRIFNDKYDYNVLDCRKKED